MRFRKRNRKVVVHNHINEIDYEKLAEAIVKANTPKEEIKYTENTLYANVILDGVVMHRNLHSLGFDENWLKNKLKEINAPKTEEILLAIASKDNDITVYNKNETLKNHDYFI